MADAEAVAEAASLPTMRFVEGKTPEQQGLAVVFRLRNLIFGQRTQTIKALRGPLTRFGMIVPPGAATKVRLVALVDDPDPGWPADAVITLKGLILSLSPLKVAIRKLDARNARRARENAVARWLMRGPGTGPQTATAIAALTPPPETFRKAGDLAGWRGLVLRQPATGGRQRLGATKALA